MRSAILALASAAALAQLQAEAAKGPLELASVFVVKRNAEEM
jgi:predicted small lipoprotein YifL